MGNSHCFGTVCDQFTADERILHAFVSHCDTVADGNSREDDRNTAGKGNALFNSINDLVQIHMSRNDVVLGAHDTDERFLDFFIG